MLAGKTTKYYMPAETEKKVLNNFEEKTEIEQFLQNIIGIE